MVFHTFASIMEHILFSIQDGVAQIVFNRPQVYNSMHSAMRMELIQALQSCAVDPQVRAIYLTGSGKAFCAGQDLQEVVDPTGPSMDKILSEGYNPIVQLIRSIEKPIVAAVNGVAAGAGANIAFACDITVASELASFTQAFSKIGLVPDSGGTWTLPRLVGLQRAAALMMLSDKITAKEAEEIGMIWKVLSSDRFEQESLQLAQKLAQMPTKALGMTKKALQLAATNSFEAQLNVEETLQTLAGNSYDYKEGVAAFLEKRAPLFKGE